MTTSVASVRISAHCDRCKTPLIVPEWSEPVGVDKTVHIWHCPVCGHEFETFDHATSGSMSDEEVITDFFPNLLVA